ncbi:ECF transporter S component [Lactobacillus sp. ESL0228]|uniref:ECF transporter S component n=1 Tax=Lactobacillus sp. ESL0228 TaxID=2069352 RepID=UPI000EFBF96A|nr:ECF transporter S component [Lactobacillus sp. ESL0228]RMC51811.1 ECF transporter S component [Lactobacillus sp. ESL0228]
MHQKQTRNMAITALFVAIFLLQTFVPNIGYIRILPTLPAITTVPLTVAVYGLLMGPKKGLCFGLLWGALRFIQAYIQPADIVSIMLFRNPVIALVPSILAGLFPGLVGYIFEQKAVKVKQLGYLIAGAVTSLTNTVMVILLTSIFFANRSTELMGYMGKFANGTPLLLALIIALGMNGIIEAVFTAVLAPLIVTPLKKTLQRLN